VERHPEKYGLEPLPHPDHELLPAMEPERNEVALREAASG